MVDVRPWAGILARHLTTFLAILALLFTIARPHAEDFVKDAVDERIGKIEKQIGQLTLQFAISEQSATRMEADMDTVKDLQAESRDTEKRILFLLQRGPRRD